MSFFLFVELLLTMLEYFGVCLKHIIFENVRVL